MNQRPMETIRVLLIEDNRLLREGIASIINEHDGFEVIARSDDGGVLKELKSQGNPPDIVLLDLGLEKVDSLELMAVIKSETPAAKIVAMGIVPESMDIIDFVKAGGSGFILKTAPSDDYIRTLRDVAAGIDVLPKVLTKSLFVQIVESALESEEGVPADGITLTRREQEVVDLISKGLSNKEIAGRLHIATFTVKSHVHNVLEKLTLNSRLQVAAWARDRRAPESAQ